MIEYSSMIELNGSEMKIIKENNRNEMKELKIERENSIKFDGVCSIRLFSLFLLKLILFSRIDLTYKLITYNFMYS